MYFYPLKGIRVLQREMLPQSHQPGEIPYLVHYHKRSFEGHFDVTGLFKTVLMFQESFKDQIQ